MPSRPLADVVPASTGATPRRVFRETVARRRLDRAAALRERLSRPNLALLFGFSFKTNPRRELLELARERGFWAETISRDELAWAARLGFAPEKTVYNGPEPLLERPAGGPLAVAFADSLEAFARNARRAIAGVHGVRLCPAMIGSRFGVPLEDDPSLHAAARALPAGAPLAVSFHARRGDFKGASWRDVAGDVLARAALLERESGRPVVAFDVGGGWTPAEFEADFVSDAGWAMDRIAALLPRCARLIAEPGQALCTPTEAIVTEVLEVRERRGRREAIADVGYSDWPDMHAYVHRLYVRRGGAWLPLGRGPDRLGGRTCLEYDLIDGLRFPPDLAPGDRLLIADTGSYDSAMAFDFARGRAAQRTLAG